MEDYIRPTHVEGGVMKDGMVRAVGTITNNEYVPPKINIPGTFKYEITVTPLDATKATEWTLEPPTFEAPKKSVEFDWFTPLAPGRMNLEQGVLKEEAQTDFEPKTYTRLDHTALAPTRPHRVDPQPAAAATPATDDRLSPPAIQRRPARAPVQGFNVHNAMRLLVQTENLHTRPWQS